MSQSVSITDLKYLSLAGLEAQKSPMLMRHGSVAVVAGKVIGRGYNNYRTNSRDGFITNVCACHAEVHCLRSMFYSQTMHKTCKPVKTGNHRPHRRYLQGINK